MKLFDLDTRQERELRRVVTWHLGYLAAITVFFSIIYYFGYFKSTRLLQERSIFTFWAPVCTAVFAGLSPWRPIWRRALEETRARLEGEPVFCVMAGLVFFFGFFIYSVLLWGLGALVPSLFYM
jgi:hypothetical protein